MLEVLGSIIHYSITPILQCSLSHLTFENLQPVVAVHQVEQPIIAAKNVIALDRLLAFPGLGDVVTDFFGTVWVGNIQGAETAAEPGDVERIVVHLFRRLMATDFKFRVRARARRKNVSRDRYRMGLIGNINDPKKGRWQWGALLSIFIRHYENVAIHNLPRHWQGGVNRGGIGWVPVKAADKLGVAHIGYVEDDEAPMPVAYVEPVSLTNRMMALVRITIPGRLAPLRRSTVRASTIVRLPRAVPDL